MGLPSIPKPIISTPHFKLSSTWVSTFNIRRWPTPKLEAWSSTNFSLKQKTKYFCILPYQRTPAAFTTFIHTVRVNSDKEVWLPHLITEIRIPTQLFLDRTDLADLSYPILSYPRKPFPGICTYTIYVEEQPRHMIFFGYPSSCG